ncbi:toprim domain-containing protein [Bartonella sp. B10]
MYEGIETGLSLLSGLLHEPVDLLASLSTSGMKALSLSSIKARLMVAMDGDEAGITAGFALAARAYQNGLPVFMLKASQGRDFNDVLLSQGKSL